MREWAEEISDYMQKKEAVPFLLTELSEEFHETALETEKFLQAAGELQDAIRSIVGKMEHANS